MLVPTLTLYATPAEYKQHYEKNYCREKIFTFDGIRVYFRQTKFGHAFYESSARDGKKDRFSKTRAERIGWIRATLENPEAELYQGWNKDGKVYDGSRRVSVVYEDFIVVIRINKTDSQGKPFTADFITAYVADKSSIGKIRNSPKWSKT
jgi:hypothetical protein